MSNNNNNNKFEQEIEVKGHLIDSMILTSIFDKIMDLDGEFRVQEFTVGKQKTDPSYARLIVVGKNRVHLGQILEAIYRDGAQPISTEDVSLEPAAADMVMPDLFYSTTNKPTQIFYDGIWIDVKNIMMDKCIVVDTHKKTAECKMIRDIKKNDMIVINENGIRIIPDERPRQGVDIFQFMSSTTSSERPTQHIIKKVAYDIYKVAALQKEKIIVVGGPVIVHSGASSSLAKLIRMGYIHGILAGNALAVHDIENALLGTSLGMNIDDGTLAVRGHRNHMQSINEVFKAGSIKNMVEQGILTKGVMYECINSNVPFVLSGSIRDDGPLPDVVTDVVEAQRQYKEVLKGAKMVIMLSSMLHSIAVGNMLPSYVKVIAVDINQSVVTKLLDRGTTQAIGIVTDVGVFLPMVLQYLQEIDAKEKEKEKC
ncbi:MAG TPA: TIGR00300 family protein [Nitrososphaeraceae archaeon]|nr:TIGR00300 family protein [Nitrososphaeraceae archaeon]